MLAILLLVTGAGAHAFMTRVSVAAEAPAQSPLAAGRSAAGVTGAELIERYRCGACHVDLPQPAAPAAWSGADPLTVLAVLRGGAAVHPDFALTEGEALAVALAVSENDERGSAAGELRRLRRMHPRATADLGRLFAQGLNCGGCHAGLPSQAGTGPVLASVLGGSRHEWVRAYLRAPHPVRPFGTRPGSGARMPDFGLNAAAADSIASYLLERALKPDAQPTSRLTLPPRRAAVADTLLDRLSCRGCHEHGGRGGRVGPPLDDVLARRTPAWIAAVVRDPQKVVPGRGMPRQPDARVEQVIRLLTTEPPERVGSSGTPVREYLSPLEHPLIETGAGRAPPSYLLWCAGCHGAAGGGDGFNARYLAVRPAVHASDTAMASRADDTLHDGIAAGGASLGRSPGMPPFLATLSAADITDLVRSIRRLCECSGPAWSREAGT